MIREQLKEAKKACRFMQNVKPEVKNKALKNISEALIQKSELIIQENQKDIAEAKNNGIKESMVDRLLLNKERIEAMTNSCSCFNYWNSCIFNNILNKPCTSTRNNDIYIIMGLN